jgi:hypothetical protein
MDCSQMDASPSDLIHIGRRVTIQTTDREIITAGEGGGGVSVSVRWTAGYGVGGIHTELLLVGTTDSSPQTET